MSPILLAITYIVCLFMGFCGGIFGYIFAKRQEKKKEDAKLKGLCKECTHRNSCEAAKMYLEITVCNNYRKWEKKAVKE